MKFISTPWIFAAVSLGATAAPNISPQMIEQFKSLPLAQQQSLAKQYGIPVEELNKKSAVTPVSRPTPVVAPREIDYEQVSQRPLVAGVAQPGELQPFGYSVFAGEPILDAPLTDMPVSDDYIIGPGDEIHVQLYGKDNAVHDLKVGREGYIDFPDLGPISATGLTFQQFRKDLEARIKEQMIGVNVFISFGSMRAMQVFVMGDAYRPGAYNVSGMATVTQVLQAAGGIDTVGSLRKIQVKRAGQKVIDVDLYKMLVWGDTSQDIRLQAGDTVFVPAKGSEVAINGLVKRPAIYELRSTASLAEVLALAGGVKAAALQEVSIERHTDTGLRVFNLTLANAHDRSFSIRDGDKISIKPSSTEYSQAIVVKGAVVRDGVYSFSPGTRVSSILKSEQRDLISATDLSYALVVREMDSQRNISVIQFNLGHALRNPGGKDDLLLQARDQVLIFRNDATDRIKETANIYSAVKDITAKSQELNNAAMMNIDASTGANVKNNELDTDNQIKLSSLSDKTATDAVVTDSRQALLAPVIERLKAQSTLGQPVKIMEVRGEVKYPGLYPLTESSHMSDAILAAGGFNEQAHIVELSRVNERGDSILVQNERFSLDIANSLYSSPLLQSKDNINVLPHPQWREEATVQVFGEVKFPGTYTVRRGESLHDLIERVGGITAYANPNGAIFARKALRQQEEERLVMLRDELRQEISTMTLRRQSSISNYSSSPAEAMTVVNQLENSKAIGRMTIDMPALLSGEKQSDILLEDGDKLYVPTMQNVISIAGMVQFPSAHIYKENTNINEYISLAGGTKKQADTDRVYVIKANGSVMLPNDSWFGGRKNLEPGDTIIVPVDSDYLDNLSIMSSATQIMYQLGVAWSAIK